MGRCNFVIKIQIFKLGMSNFMNLVDIVTKDLIFKWLLVIFWIWWLYMRSICCSFLVRFFWFMHELKVWCFCSAGDFYMFLLV